MDRDHFIKIGRDHVKALDGYDDWMAQEALHSWAADVVQEALQDGEDELAERVRLDGLVTEKPAIREAFQERLEALS